MNNSVGGLGLDGMSAQLQIDAGWALLFAVILGTLLGLERSLAGKQAGMRTYALVSLGSALFTTVGTLASLQLNFFPGVNPLQIAASVVIGIGFIGAGFAATRSEHVELTTASGVLVAAGVGMACGFGLYWLATAATVLGILVFSLFLRLENIARERYGTRHEQ